MSLQIPLSASAVSDDNVINSSASSAFTTGTDTSPIPNGTDDNPLTPATSTISPPDPSWRSNYQLDSAPDVEATYIPEEALKDIPGVSYALELFLSSHMLESEDYCHKMDETKCVVVLFLHAIYNIFIYRERLYFATGYGLIQCVKGLMSYEDEVCTFSPHEGVGQLTFRFRTFWQALITQNMAITSPTNIARSRPSLVLVWLATSFPISALASITSEE